MDEHLGGRGRKPWRATEPVLDPARQRDKHEHAPPVGSDLERLRITEGQLDVALEWIARADHRDDCATWAGAACTCWRDSILGWRRIG